MIKVLYGGSLKKTVTYEKTPHAGPMLLSNGNVPVEKLQGKTKIQTFERWRR